MKKFWFSMLSVMLLLLGTFGLSGCNTPSAVQQISVIQNPTKTTYMVNDHLDLSGGTLLVEYENGDTAQLPLSVATPDIYQLNYSGLTTIHLVFSEKITTINVTVLKKNIIVDPNFSIPDAIYNGNPNPINLRSLNTITLAQDSTYTIEYKPSHLPDIAYSTIAPTNAGEYTARISIQGGNTYQDMNVENEQAIIRSYKILPATLDRFCLNNNRLDFNFSAYSEYKYGDIIDFSRCWLNTTPTGDQYGTAPLPQSLLQDLVYQYRIHGSTTWNNIPAHSNAHTIALDAGTYDIRAYYPGNQNILEYSNLQTFTVHQHTLVEGTDYNIYLSNNSSLYVISTGTRFYYNGETYSIMVTPSQALKDTLTVSNIIYIKDSTQHNSLPPTNAGTYQVTFTISAGPNYQTIHLTRQFTIDKIQLESPVNTNDTINYTYDGLAKTFYVDGLDVKLYYSVEYALASASTPIYSSAAPTNTGLYLVRITYHFVDKNFSANYILPATQTLYMNIQQS